MIWLIITDSLAYLLAAWVSGIEVNKLVWLKRTVFSIFCSGFLWFPFHKASYLFLILFLGHRANKNGTKQKNSQGHRKSFCLSFNTKLIEWKGLESLLQCARSWWPQLWRTENIWDHGPHPLSIYIHIYIYRYNSIVSTIYICYSAHWSHARGWLHGSFWSSKPDHSPIPAQTMSFTLTYSQVPILRIASKTAFQKWEMVFINFK